MRKCLATALLSLCFTLPTAASADLGRTVRVEVLNLTHAIYFTPLLVAAHSSGVDLFEVGEPASAAIQAMAEGGVLADLVDLASDAGATYVEDPAGGVLGPGSTASTELSVPFSRRRLSLVAMVLPSNDGFVGLDSLEIPRRPGVYTYYLDAYDAGTEANDERLVEGSGALGVPGIPGDPGGNAGTGGTGLAGVEYNDTVHIHRGNHGDLESIGGPSDLDAAVHRWLNPVARLTLTVGP